MTFVDIWKACKDGNLDMVRQLTWEGQDVNEMTVDEQNTPLHFAARNGHYLVAKFLIQDCGADISLESREGMNAWSALQRSMMDVNDRIPAIKAKMRGKTSPAFEAAKLRMKMLQDTEELLRSADMANRKM